MGLMQKLCSMKAESTHRITRLSITKNRGVEMIEYTVKVYPEGNKEWFLKGKLHREDGPAVEYADGTEEWFIDGKLHREDGPAVEYAGGTKGWYLNGELHRGDGPAIEYANGTKKWYKNGELHREDGPAVEYLNGAREWFIDGKRHRLDGPAIKHTDGYKFWYIYGKELTGDEFNKQTAPAEALSSLPAQEYTIAQLEEILGRKIKIVGEDNETKQK